MRLWRLLNAASRRAACEFIQQAPEGFIVRVTEPTRSLEQNAAQWPYLEAFSRQVKWPVNGELVYMTPDDWKDVLTAAFKQEKVRLAQGWDGGVVMLGQRTSKFGKSKFSEWLEWLKFCAATKNVTVYEDERDAA